MPALLLLAMATYMMKECRRRRTVSLGKGLDRAPKHPLAVPLPLPECLQYITVQYMYIQVHVYSDSPADFENGSFLVYIQSTTN